MQPKIRKQINDQVNQEMASAYLYLGMANHYAEQGWNGFAHWFYNQATEETDHVMKLIHYLHDEQQKVTLDGIASFNLAFNTLKDPLEIALKHERQITSFIHQIYKTALEEEDYRTTQFLNWFIEEQAEEEKTVSELLLNYDRCNGNLQALALLDRELSKRG